MYLLPTLALLTNLLFFVDSTPYGDTALACATISREENSGYRVEKVTCVKEKNMMSKMDRRLLEDIQKRRQRVILERRATQELVIDQYQVTIELNQMIKPLQGATREETIRDMERQAQAYQASLIDALRDIGVTEFQVLLLSNSIKTSLTTEQIDKIAKHPDVKMIRLVQPEKVITP